MPRGEHVTRARVVLQRAAAAVPVHMHALPPSPPHVAVAVGRVRTVRGDVLWRYDGCVCKATRQHTARAMLLARELKYDLRETRNLAGLGGRDVPCERVPPSPQLVAAWTAGITCLARAGDMDFIPLPGAGASESHACCSGGLDAPAAAVAL